jgi:hypothetical protein
MKVSSDSISSILNVFTSSAEFIRSMCYCCSKTLKRAGKPIIDTAWIAHFSDILLAWFRVYVNSDLLCVCLVFTRLAQTSVIISPLRCSLFKLRGDPSNSFQMIDKGRTNMPLLLFCVEGCLVIQRKRSSRQFQKNAINSVI